MKKTIEQKNIIESIAYLWHTLFVENKIPKNGTVIEVAPGYEPKIGNALAMLDFCGKIFLIEPDHEAAHDIQKIYQQILPHATVTVVGKPLQSVVIGEDIPEEANAVVASHPFDDMVIASFPHRANFFTQEKNSKTHRPTSIKSFYHSLKNKDYECGVQATVTTWKQFVEDAKPKYFIASQYPSHALTVKGLVRRQNSGFAVLDQLKNFYKNSLQETHHENSFHFKGNPRWWIVAKNPTTDLARSIKQCPRAIERLGRSIVVRQYARHLRPDEYDVAYVDSKYFSTGADTTAKQARDLAVVLNKARSSCSEKIPTYADRQKDTTNIGLSGNRGSGRAVYYGNRFNILGVGKTTLCKSTVPSHSTGNLELIGAMRRIVLSRWINYFTKRAPEHPLLIVLKETTQRKWNPNPIPLALLIRVDDGCLDRPSHVEQSPEIPVNFEKTLTEYAKLDAEYFAYRIMLGAWSTSNYSLGGHVIDLESASFVKYRGPYYTSSSKYPHTLFGYEGFGFIRILEQLTIAKNIQIRNIEQQFYRERRKHLACCFLSLLGVDDSKASIFFSRHRNRVIHLSDQFERLAKKVNSQETSLSLYTSIADKNDPSLLDVSHLFRNLAELYKPLNAEEKAFQLLVRGGALSQTKHGVAKESGNQAEAFIQSNAVIASNQIDNFLRETKSFIHALFRLLAQLNAEKCLPAREQWSDRLNAINQDLPTMFELNCKLQSMAESYHLREISAKTLGAKIRTLCDIPNR